jgi:hypothetical protein
MQFEKILLTLKPGVVLHDSSGERTVAQRLNNLADEWSSQDVCVDTLGIWYPFWSTSEARTYLYTWESSNIT